MLDAPGGAELQFNRDLDVTQGKFGELQGGKLPGDIRIFRPESKPGANDGVELTTRNVQLDMQRIWTPHEVNFRYGGSYGSALRWLLLDAVAPVVGVLATMLVTASEESLGLLMALFGGFFLYIGAADLIPESHHAHPTFWTTFMTLVGALVLYIAIQLGR